MIASPCTKSPTGAHSWQLPEANGENALGQCRYCGQQQAGEEALAASGTESGKVQVRHGD